MLLLKVATSETSGATNEIDEAFVDEVLLAVTPE
jgi:hypothetical protein